MRLLTKETDYAIRAAVNLAARPGTFVASAEIASQERIPLQFLRRILQNLLKAGLIVSREGAAGGVRLRRTPERIRVLDIMSVFQGRVEISECMFRRQICANRRTCVLRKRIQAIEKTLEDQFAGISVADLLRDAAGPRSDVHRQAKERGAK
jgi:Rrf2 family transcriptional regulator, cysteine metabolism repressor